MLRISRCRAAGLVAALIAGFLYFSPVTAQGDTLSDADSLSNSMAKFLNSAKCITPKVLENFNHRAVIIINKLEDESSSAFIYWHIFLRPSGPDPGVEIPFRNRMQHVRGRL